MTAEPTTERGKAIVEAAREMADAAERAATAYEHGCVLTRSGAEDEAAKARAELDRLVAEWEVLSGPAFEAAALSGADSIALLIRSLHERAQQAESTRDAAQARATACEERARGAEQQSADAAALLIAAERQLAEWRGIALQGADFVHGRAGSIFIGAWADAVKEVAEAQGIDPAAGTGDHEREPGRNDVTG